MIHTQPRPAAAPAAPAVPDLVEAMASKMLELGMNGTAVTGDELFAHSDFTRDEIAAHGAAAADRARQLAVKRVS